MSARPDPRQFDMFALVAEPPVLSALQQEQERGREMIAKLVEAGLADTYSTMLGYHPRTPNAVELTGLWAMPSRLFQFPLCIKLGDATRPNRIVIQHPLLAEHPYVRAASAFTGFPVVENHGSDGWGDHGTWHHAVDLVSRGMWRDLLETRRFTTDNCIAQAVCYGLDYGSHEGTRWGKSHLSIEDARAMLAAVDADEPEDRSRGLLARVQFNESMFEKKKQRSTSWPMNADRFATAWGRIHAIEAGWLKMSRSGFLDYTDAAIAGQGALA